MPVLGYYFISGLHRGTQVVPTWELHSMSIGISVTALFPSGENSVFKVW
jgi:hypothetical protein